MSENGSHPGAEQAVPPAPQANPYAPPAPPHSGAPAQPAAANLSAGVPAQPPYYAPPQQSYGGQQQHSSQQPYGGQQAQYAAQQPYAAQQQYAAQQPYAAGQPYAAPRPVSGLAVTSLVTGIAGIVFSFAVVTLLASVVAVITGHMALKQSRHNSAIGGRGLAITGLVLGYIGSAILAITIIIGVLGLLFVGTIGFLPFFMS